MNERDILKFFIDAQHKVVDGMKVLIDMQATYAQKAMDEFEKYTKYLRPVEKK